MTRQIQLPSPPPSPSPFSIPTATWRLLLLSSAYLVLDERDGRKPRKLQSITDMVTPDLQSAMDRARESRMALERHINMLLDHASRHMVTPEAESCLRMAAASCERSECTAESNDRCVFSHTKQHLRRVTFYANRTIVNGRRDEHMYTVSKSWLAWIDAAMIVGGVCEWLNQRVAHWIDNGPRIQLHTLCLSLGYSEIEADEEVVSSIGTTSTNAWELLDHDRTQLLFDNKSLQSKRIVLENASILFLHKLGI